MQALQFFVLDMTTTTHLRKITPAFCIPRLSAGGAQAVGVAKEGTPWQLYGSCKYERRPVQ